MAELTLGFVGSAAGFAIGGPLGAQIGGFIGSTAGMLIDNVLFATSTNIDGPRLTDLSVSTSTYGAAIPLIYGPRNRLAGNVIWATDLIETKKEQSQGGKGGGGVTTTTYSYRMSLAISFGEGPVGTIGRIWANGKLIFDIDDATVAPAPSTPQVGLVATKANGTHAVFDTLRFYQGNGTQDPDPTIESHEGVGDVPAYRHTCYMVLADLQLADFGNVMPTIEVELAAHEAITAATVVRDICTRAGVTDVSVSAVQAPLEGYVVSRAGPAVSALAPLALACDFDVAEQRGQLRCVPRGLGMKGTIPVGDMGAYQSGGDPVEPIRIERQPDVSLPREAAVSYVDPELDFQIGTQRARRLLGSSENNLSHDLPVTMAADEARSLVDRLLFEAWSARRTARWKVSDKWIRMNPADLYGIPVAGQVVPFKIQRATRGANGVIEVEARFEDPEIYRSTATGTTGNIPTNPVRFPGPTRLQLMDMPIARPADDDAGFYWAASGASDGWRGADILRSSDGGATYNLMASVAVRAVMGDVAAALSAGPATVWDRSNVLTVVLHRPADGLESRSELEVLNGGNAAWLGPASGQGGEVIQFATATLTAPGTYELRDLLRGRLGTEHAVGGHGADEVFVLLDPTAVGRSGFGAGDWNKARLYKPVSVLTSEADTPSQAFTGTGEGKRPLSPVHVTGTRDAGNDLTISWIRRSRIIAPGLGNGLVALGEASEAYEVDVIVGGNPVRTIATATPEAVYTAAQQTADGITPGNPVTVRVCQMSDVRGRGHQAQAVV